MVLGNSFTFAITFKCSTFFGKNRVFIVNYHDTPPKFNDNIRKQVRFFRKHFQIIGLMEVESYVHSTEKKKKPGLVITFDDGLRSNYQLAHQVLSEFNIPATFLIPVKPCDEPCGNNVDALSLIHI